MTTVLHLPPGTDALRPWCEAGVLSPADVHVAAWIVRAAALDHPGTFGADGVPSLVVHATAMAAWAARNGHSCADLERLPAVVEQQLRARTSDEHAAELPTLTWPAATDVVAALAACPEVVRVVDGPDPDPVLDRRPLVVLGSRVYLQRHWVDECVIAAAVRARCTPLPTVLHPAAGQLLDALLPAEVDGVANAQRAAADVALQQRLAVVVGGPGTGKTYTVARLLAVLVEQARAEGRELLIGLAAPTGKAAQRLRESVLGALAGDTPIPVEVRATLEALVPRTIHRLLGHANGRRQRFAHDAHRPLPHDVVVIDETSMVSSPLFARLLESVGDGTRLVLLGDPDQLESVDRGAVLADLVHAASAAHSPLTGHVVRLRRGHRFDDDSQIARLADAVRDGDGDAAVAVLREAPPMDLQGRGVQLVPTTDPLDPVSVGAVSAVVAPSLAEARTAAERGDVEAALDAIARVRVLCAHREGPFGVSAWNRLGEQWMYGPSGAAQPWYPGRPLLVTANDPRLGLANGDTGVVVRHEGRLMAAFAGVDLLDPVQLESVDTAFAMTVHKSQGSEYPVVVMVLPPPTSPLVGRELVYTGVTRAKRALHVVGSDAALVACVATPATRMTGLADAVTG